MCVGGGAFIPASKGPAINIGEGGGYKMENCGSKTFCATPQDGKTVCAPNFKKWKPFVPSPLSVWLNHSRVKITPKLLIPPPPSPEWLKPSPPPPPSFHRGKFSPAWPPSSLIVPPPPLPVIDDKSLNLLCVLGGECGGQGFRVCAYISLERGAVRLH